MWEGKGRLCSGGEGLRQRPRGVPLSLSLPLPEEKSRSPQL